MARKIKDLRVKMARIIITKMKVYLPVVVTVTLISNIMLIFVNVRELIGNVSARFDVP